MSRSKKAKSAIENRTTSGSAYNNDLSLGDDFLDLDLASSPTGNLAGPIDFGRFQVTPLGLSHRDDWTLSEWHEFGQWLNRLSDAVQWVWGDWAVMAFQHADEWVNDDEVEDTSHESKYTHLIQKSGYSYGTLRNLKSIAERIPLSRRRDNSLIKFSHYVEIASLDQDKQEDWLDRIEAEGLSVRQLREEIQGVEKKIPPAKKLSEASEKQRGRVLSLAFKKGAKRKDWVKFARAEAQKWQDLADQIDQNS